ncbi:MOSC domain-containing protein [Snuella sedimenti]|uniref:MOSC domain-containing protein n=1 Tax=Snuella sedimenti TaxID=2798802 RepID=A0A8J7IES1_9FLAO|nr:MOSC domain-containing protein [Snuella sedimenti]MBJ6366842.1 MOSC domain-containing protein [Snuella sedimenti]
MNITSTNIATPQTFVWQGKEVTSGIFKTPVNTPIFLGKESVNNDFVSDTKVHGGYYKACYLFSADHYPYWKALYPNLNWDWGMFGENLTVAGLDETKIHVGDIYKMGSALVQVSQPREPCFKLGAKFGSQEILKQFIAHKRPGTYISILKEGSVSIGDSITLVERMEKSLSVAELFHLFFSKTKDDTLIEIAMSNEALPQHKRDKLKSFLGKAPS